MSSKSLRSYYHQKAEGHSRIAIVYWSRYADSSERDEVALCLGEEIQKDDLPEDFDDWCLDNWEVYDRHGYEECIVYVVSRDGD